MVDVVYIMGHGYSGSTLLTFLLGSHRDVATVGEMGIAPAAKKSPDEFLCSCHAKIRECPFWGEVTAAMARRQLPFDVWELDPDFRPPGRGLAPLILGALQRGPVLEAVRRLGLAVVPSARRELARLLKFHSALVHAITEVRGCSTLVDSSKRPERAVYLRRAEDLDVYVVHLVRDARAVAHSTMRHLGVSAEAAARSWQLDNRAAEHARPYFPANRWLTVRYEDLCNRREAALADIFRFAGLDPEQREPDYWARDHHIIGNDMRLAPDPEIRLDERWKQGLAATDRSVVETLAGPMNSTYGYA